MIQTEKPIKLLTFSSLYPNEQTPHHGVFVENRLRYLLKTGRVESKVIAPVPWFPLRWKVFGEYGQFAAVPKHEERHGVEITHPRYLVIPKIGMNWTPSSMVSAALPEFRKLIKDGYDFDLIDAHYFYPDGVAAIRIGKILNKPVIITARGTDLNLIPQFSKPRKNIQWAADHAQGMVTVCQALKDSLVSLGVAESRVEVRRNGVDLEMFTQPEDRDALRSSLGINGNTILSVGHLIERKGHHLIIEAMKYLHDFNLLIAGQGPELNRLKEVASENDVEDRVRFLGAIPHQQMKDYYGAADILVLASSREGWANVLLESMACGTPVAATDIWGTPEVVAAPEAGVLIKHRNAKEIALSVQHLMSHYPERSATRVYAELFSWDDTVQGLLNLFNKVVYSDTATS
ncbi:MAG: glycosyltransferase family 4 protein [Sedimenticola sp.]